MNKPKNIFLKSISKYKKIQGILVCTSTPELEKYKKQKPNWYVRPQQDAREIYKNQHDLRRKLLQNDLTRIIRKFPKQKVTFLDLGCGDGMGLKDVEPFKNKLMIYGTDYNMLRLLRAKQIAPDATLFLADVNVEIIRPNSCDIILLNHVLEHVPDDIGLLKKIYSYLSPGGYLLLGVPQEGTLIYRIRDYLLEPYIPFITDHVHFYTSKKLIRKVKEAGFQVMKLTYLDYAFPHSIIDKYLRKSKTIHDFMETAGKVFWPQMGAGALWLVLKKPSTKDL